MSANKNESATVPARKMTPQQSPSSNKRLSMQPQASSKHQKRILHQRQRSFAASTPTTSGCISGMTEVWWSAKKYSENAALVKTAVGQAINTTVTGGNPSSEKNTKPKPGAHVSVIIFTFF